MKKQTDEPAWLGAGGTVFSTVVLVIVFGLILPLIFLTILDMFDFRFQAIMPFWAQLTLFGFTPSIIVLKIIDKFTPLGRNVPPGAVQFVRCMIPGINLTFKLGPGYHLLLPFFENWGHAWYWYLKWDIAIKQFRINLKGTSDIIIDDAKATGYPDKDFLLALHMIGKDEKDASIDNCTEMRRKFVVENMESLLKSIIESSVSNLREECDSNSNSVEADGTKRIDNADDVIARSDEVRKAIKAELKKRKKKIAKKFGFRFEFFNLGDINLPEDVVYQRDNTTTLGMLRESAEKMAVRSKHDDIDGTMSLKEAMHIAQLHDKKNTKVTDTTTVKRTGVESATLKAISEVAKPLLEALGEILKKKAS